MKPTLTQVSKLLPSAENKAVLITDWQNSSDLIKAIASCHKENLKYGKKIAYLFKGATDLETCRNVWDFLRYEIPYKVESGDAQKVKTFPRFLADSKPSINGDPVGNDCKMYAVFTNVILQCCGIESCYRFVSYKGKQPTHTYTVVPKLNLVIDAVLPNFDAEKPFKHKKDMSLYKMSGVQEEESSRKYLDLSSVDSTIGAFNIKKTVQKSKASVQKAVNSIPKVADKVVQGMKTTSLAVPRNAFLGLVALNVRGFATSLMNAINKGNDLKWWVQLGGDRSKLIETAKSGSKKKRILGFEEDINSAESLVVSGICESGMIGVEPVSTTTALASAVPVIAKFLTELKKMGIKPEDLKNVADAVQTGNKAFKDLTGKSITEVAFSKDTGKAVKKISLKPTDLKTVPKEMAEKLATAVVKNATGVTDAEIQQTLIEEPKGGSQQKSADAPSPDKADSNVKQPVEDNFFTKNKFYLIGGALLVGGLLLFSKRKK
jgi:hypothetical protein